MGRSIHKLTARQVDAFKDAGRYGDGGGLYLRVTKTGSKRWVLRYTQASGGKSREMGLGSANRQAISLARARELAQDARDAILEGKDPVAARDRTTMQSEDIPNFGVFADEFVAVQIQSFRNAKHIAQWKMTLTKYAAPLRPKNLNEITTDDVLSILRPMWQGKNETASRLRGRIEKVLDAAKAKGLRSGENPARWRGHLELLLPKRQKLQRGHHKALNYEHIPQFFADLHEREGMAALALEFLILAACRSGEVRQLKWTELNFDTKVWCIPAEKIKSGKPHRIPLTNRMLEIIKQVRPWSSEDIFVFPSTRRNHALSDTGLSNVLKRMEVNEATVHGFRSSFRDWVGDETDFPREVAEAALAHVVGNETERAYRRKDAFEKRVVLMNAWQDYCLKTT